MICRWSNWLLERVIDAGLVTVIFVVPLLMGGGHPLGRLVFASLVLGTASLWLLKQLFAKCPVWRRTGAELLLAASLLLVAAQLTPWPAAWRTWMSGTLDHLLPLWTLGHDEPAACGTWTFVSVYPDATRAALVMLVSYALWFHMVLQRMGTLDHVERQLRWTALAAVGMALLGLGQFLWCNGKFLWIYDYPYHGTRGAVTGSLTHRDHFAHFLALGFGSLIWWLLVQRVPSRVCRSTTASLSSGSLTRGGPSGLKGVRDQAHRSRNRPPSLSRGRRAWRFVLPVTSIGMVAAATLLSFSSAGMVVVLLAAATFLVLATYVGLLSRHSALNLLAVGLVVASALLAFGYQPLADRLAAVVHADSRLDVDSGRTTTWAAVCRGIPDFLVLGSGFGTHREVYPIYSEGRADVEYTQAQCGYLQVLLEGGIPGLLLLLAGMALCVVWCARALSPRQSLRVRAGACAATTGVVVSAVHALFGSVWYLPACMALALVHAACVCRLSQLPLPRLSRDVSATDRIWVPSRWMRMMATAMVMLTAVLAIRWCTRRAVAAWYWDRYLLTVQRRSEGTKAWDGPRSGQTLDAMAADLYQAVRWHGSDARAHLRLAAIWLERFDAAQRASPNALPLSQIRHAAQAASFASREGRARWLARVLGNRREYLDRALAHARRAVHLCPVAGEGYLYLAELSFLEDDGRAPPVSAARYLDQALRVRPHSGPVLLAAGSERILQGDWEAGIDYLRRAFQQGQAQTVIELFGSQCPGLLLDDFPLDIRSTRLLVAHCERTGRSGEARRAAERLAELLRAQ